MLLSVNLCGDLCINTEITILFINCSDTTVESMLPQSILCILGSCDGTLRLRNALISESDDFGPMGGRYQLQTEDQHSNNVTGMSTYLRHACHFVCRVCVFWLLATHFHVPSISGAEKFASCYVLLVFRVCNSITWTCINSAYMLCCLAVVTVFFFFFLVFNLELFCSIYFRVKYLFVLPYAVSESFAMFAWSMNPPLNWLSNYVDIDFCLPPNQFRLPMFSCIGF